MSRLATSVACLMSLFGLLAACGDDNKSTSDAGGGDDAATAIDAAPVPDAEPDAWIIPVLRNPVGLPDAELAVQAAAILGEGGTMNCNRCHSLSRSRLQSWETESTAAVDNCLTDTSPTTQAAAAAIVECFREVAGDANAAWQPAKMGIYDTAAGLAWFEYVFRLAFPTTWEAQLDIFKAQVWMPRGDTGQLDQGQFDIVAEWFARGLPGLTDVIPADPPIDQCVASISPDVATHVMTMKTQGWRAVNAENGILMFGCAGATETQDCMATYPGAGSQSWNTGWDSAEPTTTFRILRENTYSSAYWTRSSADGRFVSHGGSSASSQTYRSTVIDLVTDTEIPAAAYYDPGFFPDNSGFALQGSGARFCEQSLLTTSPTMISFDEPQCIHTNAVGLYQHLGAALGGDYWTVDGQFVSDNGGHSVTSQDFNANFGTSSRIDLTPMVHEGNQFVPHVATSVAVPLEGDTVISPSAKLLVSRANGSGGQQSGYILRKLVATPNGGSYSVDVPEIARYCERGGKPAISYDERWMVYHHYVEANDWASLGYASASDPGFVALRNSGAANLFLLDLPTGTVRRITTMNPGQYALYPHFRSDGWIYFLVRDRNRGVENIVASDAALVYE